jgi:ribosomal protein L18
LVFARAPPPAPPALEGVTRTLCENKKTPHTNTQHAGVVGLACARALALAGVDTLLLERGAAFGCEQSSRSSEVIHAGLYYAPGR